MNIYKVTKIRYQIPYKGTEYKVDKKSTIYTTNKTAVTLAWRHVEHEQVSAAHYQECYGRPRGYKYEIHVEIGELPETKPAVYCEKHGVQLALNVPGLTSELTCIECI